MRNYKISATSCYKKASKKVVRLYLASCKESSLKLGELLKQSLSEIKNVFFIFKKTKLTFIELFTGLVVLG